MNPYGYQLLWLFFIYSLLGWFLETTVAAIRQKRFVNRGFINGPACIIYGIGAVLITITLQDLQDFWLLLGHCRSGLAEKALPSGFRPNRKAPHEIREASYLDSDRIYDLQHYRLLHGTHPL